MAQEQYLHILQVIREDKRDVGGDLQRGASDAEMEELQTSTRRELGNSLPSSYVEFLRITDGLSWAGVAIYGTSASPIVGFPNRRIFGFLESNIAFRNSSALFENYLIIGSDGDSLLPYSISKNCYEVFTVFMTPLDMFNTFEEMICHILNRQM
jgi:hypothetical protein